MVIQLGNHLSRMHHSVNVAQPNADNAVSTNPQPRVGSEAWLGVSDHEPESIYHTRATSFFEAVNWTALLTIASRHNDNIPCKYTGSFSMGHFNMTRRIDFYNGTSWIARLRFPLDAEAAQREALPREKVMQLEVAIMKFLRYAAPIYCCCVFRVILPFFLLFFCFCFCFVFLSLYGCAVLAR